MSPFLARKSPCKITRSIAGGYYHSFMPLSVIQIIPARYAAPKIPTPIISRSPFGFSGYSIFAFHKKSSPFAQIRKCLFVQHSQQSMFYIL